ncbi:hypothetical protein [Nostoc sp. GT001]|uniref:hypothetical protein n=1 Tax=Nostoc sp. GT001 TaxID=3056647 RepID=UPI0025AB4F4A|nr:hypothetical protein [Nostoc sp. GT001]MDM9583155.1 hypothetical protein [Nostoc sp. GT001]
MTHSIYTVQQLQELKLGEIKAIAFSLGVAPEGDKRNKDVWANAIVEYQKSQVEKLSGGFRQIDVSVAVASIFESQDVAQAELEAFVEEQAEEIAPDLQRLQNNQQGYQDATNGLEMQSIDPCYRSGYDRGLRDASSMPKQCDSEAIAFEKIGQTIRGGVWEAVVDDIQILIVGVSGGYKSNLTGVRLIEDFGAMIKETIVAVAKIQEKQKLESAVRSPRAQAITVLEQQGDEFVVENSTNQNRYTVRPKHQDPNSRCGCADCRHRGTKCKHQIAVENFLKPSLVEQASLEEDRKNLILYSYEKNSFVAYDAGVEVRQATIKTLLDQQFYLMDNDDVIGEFQIICQVA